MGGEGADRWVQVREIEIEGEISALVVLHLFGGVQVQFKHVNPVKEELSLD